MTNTGINEWIGRQVETAIKNNGIKKTAVSEKTGMPYSTLNSKLKGYSAFTVEELFKIAIAVNADPMDFMPLQFGAEKVA